MGILAGLLASALGLAGAYLAAELVTPWLGLFVLGMVGLGFAIPMHRYGHRQFRGGGNTDFWLFFTVFGIALALAIPRYNRNRACEALADFGAWLQSAQEAFHDQQGHFADSDSQLTGLALDVAEPPSAGVRISVDSSSVGFFAATLTHGSCPDPVSVQIRKELPAPEPEVPDTAATGIS